MASSLIPIRTTDVEAIGEMVILKVNMDELRSTLNRQAPVVQNASPQA
jgi:hypothetical protein